MILIKNIKQLIQVEENTSKNWVAGKEMDILPSIENAWLLIDGELISDFGKMATCPKGDFETIDAHGKLVFPSWCDSHTHIIFAGTREGEFSDRLHGLSYQEIAKKGGGILNSAKKLGQTSEEELYHQAMARIDEIIQLGTGLLEIKSGYGLTLESELKILRVAKKIKQNTAIEIKTSFLGAHAIPLAYKNNREGYIQLIINEMIPAVAQEHLADYIDVFCEKVAFTPEETERIIIAGKKYGLMPKIHTNQFNSMGGIEVSVTHNALSVDHLEVLNDEEIAVLKNAKTISTLLPSAPFFLNDPYPPARKMISNGLAVALASDFNPGSSPSGNMQLVISLACIKMKMTPKEAINAATLNGAYALGLSHKFGSIKRGKVANIFITKPISTIDFIPYSFGSNNVEIVLLKGQIKKH